MTLLYEFYVTAGKLATCHTDANDFDGMALPNVSTFFIFLTLLDKLKGKGSEVYFYWNGSEVEGMSKIYDRKKIRRWFETFL